MPEMGEMSVIPAAWATMSPAKPSQTVPVTATRAACPTPMSGPPSMAAAKSTAKAPAMPTCMTCAGISSLGPPPRGPSTGWRWRS